MWKLSHYKPSLTCIGYDGTVRFADRESLDSMRNVISGLSNENNKLRKELEYKEQVLNTVLKDLDDACDEVLELQEKIDDIRRKTNEIT